MHNRNGDEPEPIDLTHLNIEASMMCLASKVMIIVMEAKIHSYNEHNIAVVVCEANTYISIGEVYMRESEQPNLERSHIPLQGAGFNEKNCEGMARML